MSAPDLFVNINLENDHTSNIDERTHLLTYPANSAQASAAAEIRGWGSGYYYLRGNVSNRNDAASDHFFFCTVSNLDLPIGNMDPRGRGIFKGLSDNWAGQGAV